MATKSAAKPAAKKTPTASKAPAKKAPAKRAAPKADPPVELTPIDDGVSINVGDAVAEVKITGRFDLDGLIAVNKRVARARAELS